MIMRLCTPLSLCLAAAALHPASPAQAAASPSPPPAAGSSCADGPRFPLTTRIHGGPAVYEAGGGYRTWYLDLTNTTARTCANIHPVVVLVDEGHALTPVQPRLEFYDGSRPHPVRLETTDEDELVGAFDDGFRGFTVGPRRTVTVKVRLALASDAVPNEVTANAAVVQRHDDDGDWVGQSNDYRFRIEGGLDPDTGADTGTGIPPSPGPSATGPGGRGDSLAAEVGELARTGLGSPGRALAGAAALLVAGGALLLARRRR
ncbi:hypothetical protein ACYF6T_17400 [Streptomyces sp. 7R007]